MNMPIDRAQNVPNDVLIDITENANTSQSGWDVRKLAAGHIKVLVAWTAADIAFKGSDDNVLANAVQIMDKTGAAVKITSAAALLWLEIPESVFHGARYIFPYSVNTGTGAAEAQAADRTLVARFKS